jgi:NAD+ kinase
MILGIIPNTTKQNVLNVVDKFIVKLEQHNIHFYLSSSIKTIKSKTKNFKKINLLDDTELIPKSDIIVSIGGDGTLLNTAYKVRKYGTPILGLNFGKLGFLVEFDLNEMDQLIEDLKIGNYTVEERMGLSAICHSSVDKELYAINDIVIDRGHWPKMIEMTIQIDGEYVSTFSADGVIIATPTGSTGYSLSTGGPIVNPKAHAITLCPISPHALTMRPLVLSSEQKISIIIKTHPSTVQISCDGQRVQHFNPPISIDVVKSVYPMRLVHTFSTSYFEILRKKLYWGLDVRKNNHF